MTLISPPAAVDRYVEDFEALSESGLPEWLLDIRRRAWSIFSRLGFPIKRRGNELWKYTNLKPVADADFEFGEQGVVSVDEIKGNIPWDDSWETVVIVDGVFSPTLSNIQSSAGLTTGSLAKAFVSGTGEIEVRFATLAGREDYAFTTLNTAFAKDGAHIEIARDTELHSPVHVVFVTSASKTNRSTYPRLFVHALANSSIVLIETYINLADSSQLTVPVTEIFADSGTNIRHYRVQMENEDSYHLGTTRVRQLENSSFTSTSFAIGASIARNDIHTQLDAPGAVCTLHGLYMTSGDQHQDQEISTTHALPSCSSDQFYKGILSGNSHAVFSGKVVVERDAQKSEANQKDLNLLLSRHARIDAKPSLEIYADDIKAAHGATAGHVDRDTLFYLHSRGIDEETAKALLIRGFAEEILDEFQPEALRDFVERMTDEQIPILLEESDTIGTS